MVWVGAGAGTPTGVLGPASALCRLFGRLGCPGDLGTRAPGLAGGGMPGGGGGSVLHWSPDSSSCSVTPRLAGRGDWVPTRNLGARVTWAIVGGGGDLGVGAGTLSSGVLPRAPSAPMIVWETWAFRHPGRRGELGGGGGRWSFAPRSRRLSPISPALHPPAPRVQGAPVVLEAGGIPQRCQPLAD